MTNHGFSDSLDKADTDTHGISNSFYSLTQSESATARLQLLQQPADRLTDRPAASHATSTAALDSQTLRHFSLPQTRRMISASSGLAHRPRHTKGLDDSTHRQSTTFTQPLQTCDS